MVQAQWLRHAFRSMIRKAVVGKDHAPCFRAGSRRGNHFHEDGFTARSMRSAACCRSAGLHGLRVADAPCHRCTAYKIHPAQRSPLWLPMRPHLGRSGAARSVRVVPRTPARMPSTSPQWHPVKRRNVLEISARHGGPPLRRACARSSSRPFTCIRADGTIFSQMHGTGFRW